MLTYINQDKISLQITCKVANKYKIDTLNNKVKRGLTNVS